MVILSPSPSVQAVSATSGCQSRLFDGWIKHHQRATPANKAKPIPREDHLNLKNNKTAMTTAKYRITAGKLRFVAGRSMYSAAAAQKVTRKSITNARSHIARPRIRSAA